MIVTTVWGHWILQDKCGLWRYLLCHLHYNTIITSDYNTEIDA